MKRYTFIIAFLALGLTFNACSSKKTDDPITSIEALSEKISSSGDEWEEEKWNEAAEELKEALDNLPSPLESNEEITLSSSLSAISVVANMHERKAAKVIDIINTYNGNKEEVAVEEVVNKSCDLGGAVYKYPITMHIDIEGSQVKGTYYYNKRGPNAKLSLSGTYEDGKMDLNECDENGTPTGHFKGDFDGNTFKGQFIDNKGKSMNFMVSETGTSVDEALAAFEEDIDEAVESLPDYGDDDEEVAELGDESVDEFIKEYEKFWKNYMSLLKKAQNNDPSALLEYMQLLSQANEYSEKLQKLSDKMSIKQYEKLNKMSLELMQEVNKISK